MCWCTWNWMMAKKCISPVLSRTTCYLSAGSVWKRSRYRLRVGDKQQGILFIPLRQNRMWHYINNPAKHLTKGTENATQIWRAWWQVMWRANKIAGWHEMQLGTKPSCQALLCSAISPEWFGISAFCQGTALIGQGRVGSILSNRGQVPGWEDM